MAHARSTHSDQNTEYRHQDASLLHREFLLAWAIKRGHSIETVTVQTARSEPILLSVVGGVELAPAAPAPELSSLPSKARSNGSIAQKVIR